LIGQKQKVHLKAKALMNIPLCQILYIKATVSVCVGSAWKILPVIARSCGVCLSVVTNRAGQGGQGSRCGGPGEVPFLLKKSLGKTGGPTSNQTKIQFLKIYIFIIEHI